MRGSPDSIKIKQSTAMSPITGLTAWLFAQGGTVGPVHFEQSKLGAGVGCFAQRPLVNGEQLCAVPFSATITADIGELCEEGPRAALAARLARELLDAEASNYHQYTTILPRRGESEMHMLWWSEVEREALIGSNAALECESLSVEVREVGRMLGLGMLADKVRRHGRVEVQEAVRTAYVSVLSRSFSLGEGDDARQVMVPVIDWLQHSGQPTVTYAAETCPQSGEAWIIARSNGDQPVGVELTLDYGDHPAFVFATHYAFVPPLAQRCSLSYTHLCFEEGAGIHASAQLGLGAAAVLAAQEAAEGEVEVADDADERGDDQALAALLRGAGTASSWPLTFGISLDDLDNATAASTGALAPLCTSARLCSLEDDGTGASAEAQVQRATRKLLRTPSHGLDGTNDVEAAALLTRTACAQQRLLDQAEERAMAADAAAADEAASDKAAETFAAVHGERSSSGHAPKQEDTRRQLGAARRQRRSDCRELARAVRTSERRVLHLLCSGPSVGRLFGLTD